MKRVEYGTAVVLLALGSLIGCSKKARLLNHVKVIPISGASDTVYFERSSEFDRFESSAAVDSNRQVIAFEPHATPVFATLENMGEVPLRRDTIHRNRRFAAEQFLRTGTRDTTMHLRIEFPNDSKPATDVIVLVRNVDSVYREILFR